MAIILESSIDYSLASYIYGLHKNCFDSEFISGGFVKLDSYCPPKLSWHFGIEH